MRDPVRIVPVDTVTALDDRHIGAVIVTGSHGGMIAARYASQAKVRAAIFNDAGCGFEEAGIAGLAALDAIGMAAAAVSHVSARIADGGDSLSNGIVSHANANARRWGVEPGTRCREAARLLVNAALPIGALDAPSESRHLLLPATHGLPPVLGLDSIGCAESRDAGAILVIGSHGALHGGDPASALPIPAAAAFFHDAGRGKDDVGVSRLPVLAAHGIAAGTVDYRTARIGDARSMWATGVLSCINAALAARAVREGERLADVVVRLRFQPT